MNRRTSIKNIAFFSFLAFSSFSIFKCFNNRALISIYEIDFYKSLIAELAETIIPKTETPGAKDTKVEEFIILIIKDCYSKRDQQIFLRGLTDLVEFIMEKYNCDFIDCSESDKIEVLNHFKNLDTNTNNLVNQIKHRIFGYSFYYHLHALTVEGFCTSELGATQVLAYDYIPGSYSGCISLQPQQKSWAI